MYLAIVSKLIFYKQELPIIAQLLSVPSQQLNKTLM